MNAVQYRTLLSHGFTEEGIITLEDVFSNKTKFYRYQ